MKDKLELGKKRAEELGLRHQRLHLNTTDVYFADDIHKLLGNGVEVRGGGHYMSPKSGPTIRSWSAPCLFDQESDDHSALLIGIKPITPPSEERQIIQAMVNSWDSSDKPITPEFVQSIDRARGWLAKEKS